MTGAAGGQYSSRDGLPEVPGNICRTADIGHRFGMTAGKRQKTHSNAEVNAEWNIQNRDVRKRHIQNRSVRHRVNLNWIIL